MFPDIPLAPFFSGFEYNACRSMRCFGVPANDKRQQHGHQRRWRQRRHPHNKDDRAWDRAEPGDEDAYKDYGNDVRNIRKKKNTEEEQQQHYINDNENNYFYNEIIEGIHDDNDNDDDTDDDSDDSDDVNSNNRRLPPKHFSVLADSVRRVPATLI